MLFFQMLNHQIPPVCSTQTLPDLADSAARCLLQCMEGKPVEKETIIPVSICKRDSTR